MIKCRILRPNDGATDVFRLPAVPRAGELVIGPDATNWVVVGIHWLADDEEVHLLAYDERADKGTYA